MWRFRLQVLEIDPLTRHTASSSKGSLFSQCRTSDPVPGFVAHGVSPRTPHTVRDREARSAAIHASLARSHVGINLRVPDRDERSPPRCILNVYSEPFPPEMLRIIDPVDCISSIFKEGGWLDTHKENELFLMAEVKTKGCLTSVDNLVRLHVAELSLVDMDDKNVSPLGRTRSIQISHMTTMVGRKTTSSRLNRYYIECDPRNPHNPPPLGVVWNEVSVMFGEKIDMGPKSVSITGNVSGPKYKGATESRDIFKDFQFLGVVVPDWGIGYIIQYLTESSTIPNPMALQDQEDEQDDEEEDQGDIQEDGHQ